jgi:CO/xanthine dehydrogenase Mo-binding subunit
MANRDAVERAALNRRGFIAASVNSTLVMGFALALPGCGDSAEAPVATSAPPPVLEPTVWFQVDAGGNVQVNVTKAEMGQHVGTALSRIVAEELGADWSKVSMVHVDTDPRWGDMITGGSWSVFTSFNTLARAGAAGRTVLVEAAAELLGVAPGDCRAQDGRVSCGERSLDFGEIVSRGAIDRSFTAEQLAAMPVKPAAERSLIGRDTRALDVGAKTDGTAVYGLDVELPGMVYARPVMPPTRYGSEVVSVDDSAAKQLAGYRQYLVLEDPSEVLQGWVLVIADSFPAASAAAEALQVSWTPGAAATVGEADLLAEGARLAASPDSGETTIDDGDVAAARDAAATRVSSVYTTGSVLHFPMEPMNAVAEFRDGELHIHCGNQWQSLILPTLATAAGIDPSQVTIHQYYLGGGFGRRLWGDYMIPSILAAKALGVPVKTVFTREDDSRFDCIRSPSVQQFDASLDAQGRVTGMEHALAAGWPTLAMVPGFMFDALSGGKVDPFSHNGANHWYSLPSHRVRAVNNELVQSSLLPGWLRSVGVGWICWGVEGFMDELAHAAGADPVAFRLSLLDASGKQAGTAPESVGGARRLAAVLEQVREQSGWGRELPPGEGLGVAVSSGQERTMPTWVATVAHVAVSADNRVTVKKICSVIDCGTVVHPDGAMAQAEGATLWGMSLALYENAAFADGQVSVRNLDAYRPLRMADVPELDIQFIDNDHFPTGLGEPPMTAVAPAIANAVFAATGQRVRDLPIRLAQEV